MIGVIGNAGVLAVIESFGGIIDPSGETWSMPTHRVDHSLMAFVPIQKVSKSGQRNDAGLSRRFSKRGK